MKKIISSVILSAVVLISVIGLNYFTTKELKAQNIGTLQSIVTPGFSFKKDLMLGDTDPDVRQLQKVLNADIDTMIISDDVGSRGKETTYFGPITKAAVIKFQNKYKSTVLDLNGITVADGKVNKATRTRLNLLIGVMNTYDSVGLPQSRASTVVVVPPAPVIAPTPTQSGMSICNFIDILVSINVVTPERANSARSTMGCAVSSTFVDLKANGSNGPITVPKNSSVTLSWTTGGMVSCVTGSTNKALSGSEVIALETTNRSITLTCRTATGSNISDSITVNVSGNNPILLSTGGYDFGYTTALFSINTNVPTKSYITYWTINKDDAKTASFTTLKSSRAEAITGLTPDTTYHFTIKIVDANGNDFTSPEYIGRTASSPDGPATSTPPTASSTANLAQRVLYSSDGNGVVSILGSESLKLTSKMTLEAWVKPTSWSSVNGISGTQDQVIIAKGRVGDNVDYALSLDNGKLVYSNNDASMWTCSPTVSLNQWTHVAVSVDETSQSVEMYVNGSKVGTTTPANNVLTGVPACLVSTNDSRYQISSSACSGASISIINSSTTSPYHTASSTTLGTPSCITSTNDSRFPLTGSVCTGSPIMINNASTTSMYRIITPRGSTGVVTALGNTTSFNPAICEGPRGVFNKTAKINKLNAIANKVDSYIDQGTATPDYSAMSIEQIMSSVNAQVSTSAGETSNVYLGNFYPKMCSTVQNNNNGFVGYLDDLRIWNTVRTGVQIKDKMNKSVKGSTGLVGYYTFDDGTASDVSREVNTGDIKGGMEIIEGDSTSTVMVGPDISQESDYTVTESCDPPEEEIEEVPSKYGAAFSGYVFEIEKCADSSNNYHQVIVKPCEGETSIVSGVTNNPNNPSDAPVKSASEYSISAKGSLVALFYPGYGDPMPKVGDSILGTADTNGEAKCQTVSMKADGVSASVLGKSIGIITESGVGGKSCAPKGSRDICNNLFESIGDLFDHANCKGGFRFW